MPKKTSKLAVASLAVFIIAIVSLGFAFFFRSVSGIAMFLVPIFYRAIQVSTGLAIISLVLFLVKRHKLKGIIYSLVILILSIFILVYISLYPSTLSIFVPQCPSTEKAIFFEFPHYENKSLNPDDREGPEGCVANFRSLDSPDQVRGYYREQLQEHGWNITKDENVIRDIPTNKGTFFENKVKQDQHLIYGERNGFEYTVVANLWQIDIVIETTEVRIGIQKMK